MNRLHAIVPAVVTGAVVLAAGASADTTAEFGTAQRVVTGPIVASYLIDTPHPSSDKLDVPIVGTLYEADTTVNAVAGTTLPAIPLFNARSEAGQTYKVLQIATPDGLSPAPLMQGQQTSGKLYFDVTGTAPTEVVYSDNAQQSLVWST